MAGGNQVSVAFDEFLFLKIFRTFRMAIQPTKLIITSVALGLICLSGWLMDFSRTVAIGKNDEGNIVSELQKYMDSPDSQAARESIETLRQSGQRSGVFKILWSSAATHFKKAVDAVFSNNPLEVAANIKAFFISLEWAVRYHFIY